jgi:hypothetical protein
MRNSCLYCARKHLGKAEVLSSEALLGYPEYQWLVVGNLSEAEDECVVEYPELASEIREHRQKYMEDIRYRVPFLDLIKKATALVDAGKETITS